MTEAVPQAQASLYETTIENAELESALEKRQKAKDAAKAARAALKVEDEKAKGLIATLDLEGGAIRVGRFVVSQSSVAARSVAFETDPTTRLNISLLDDAA